MNRRIELWYDETSDSERPRWCVSDCDDDGENACLFHSRSRERARAKAEEIARTSGFPLAL